MAYVKRFLARFFDYSLLYSLLYLIGYKLDIIRNHILIGALVLLVPLIWICIESALLTLCQSTPGKFLMGIRIKKKISFALALKRSLRVWAQVMGCGLPPFSLICPLIALFQGRKKELSFDLDLESQKTGVARGAVCLMLALSLSLSSFAWDRLGKQTRSLDIAGELYANWSAIDDARLSMQFPSLPNKKNEELPIPNHAPLAMTEYAIEHKNLTYSVAYAELPQKWLGYSDNMILKHSIKGMAAELPNTEILSKAYANHGSYNAAIYHLSSQGKEVLGKFVMVNSYLYKVELSYDPPYNEDIQAKMDLFTQSLLPKN